MTKGRTTPPQPATLRIVGPSDIAAQEAIPYSLAACDLALWLFWQAAPMRPKLTEDGSIIVGPLNMLVTRVADHPTTIKYVLTAIDTGRILGMVVLGATHEATHVGYVPMVDGADNEAMLAAFREWCVFVRQFAADALKTRPVPWGIDVAMEVVSDDTQRAAP
jgi:hypothetical protein